MRGFMCDADFILTQTRSFKLYNFKVVKYLLFFILLLASLTSAQDSNIEKYQFISPLPDSRLIMPETNIIFRQGDTIDPTTIKELSIKVIGSISGLHPGEFFLSDDMRTLIFIPSLHFTPGEKVNVKLYSGIYTINSEMLRPLNFNFYISQSVFKPESKKPLYYVLDFPYTNANYGTYLLNNNCSPNNGLPEDFPTFSINVHNNPSKGYLFLAPFYWPEGEPSYLTIINNDGIPIFYRRLPKSCFDFKLNKNGLLTYYDGSRFKFIALDSSYAIVDSFSAGNGYSNTDVHDLQILPNGHALLMTRDWQTVRMDTIVPGGDTAAVVIGLIIQELDASKEVIFQWRSWDHFEITDATEDIDLTAHTIDYVHGNTLEVDYDSNILLSSRNLDEITKINKQTGEIIWRFGGIKSRNNQFVFINDPRTFSHQHDVRRVPNGNVTLFDNGNLLIPRYSSSLEYDIDEQNKTATLIWEYHDQSVYSYAMGSSRRLNDGHTLLGWGSNIFQSVTEVSNNVTKTFELIYDSAYNYRAFRFPWKTKLFITEPDSVFFESVPVGDSATISVDLINNSANPVDITGYYNLDRKYVVENPVPFSLPPYGIILLHIKFIPDEDGYFKDYLHIRSDTETTRVTQVMILAGRTDTIFSTVEEDDIIYNYVLEQNYPNPFNPSTTIKYSIPVQSKVKIKIYNSIGENIAELVNSNQSAGSYQATWDAGIIASGIYFYSIEAVHTNGSEYFRSVRKMILLK
jgi:hypothetical protein